MSPAAVLSNVQEQSGLRVCTDVDHIGSTSWETIDIDICSTFAGLLNRHRHFLSFFEFFCLGHHLRVLDSYIFCHLLTFLSWASSSGAWRWHFLSFLTFFVIYFPHFHHHLQGTLSTFDIDICRHSESTSVHTLRVGCWIPPSRKSLQPAAVCVSVSITSGRGDRLHVIEVLTCLRQEWPLLLRAPVKAFLHFFVWLICRHSPHQDFFFLGFESTQLSRQLH